MLIFACLFQLLLVVFASVLWLRVGSASLCLRNYLHGSAKDSKITAALFTSHLQSHTDSKLLLDADCDGLASLPVQSRELNDPYENVEELTCHLIRSLEQYFLNNSLEVIKALYQLQDSVGLSDTTLLACLDPIISDLRQLDFLGETIGQVEIVHGGEYLDRNKMWPLTPGTRVRQPLGVVIHNQYGQVISKAKVLCH